MATAHANTERERVRELYDIVDKACGALQDAQAQLRQAADVSTKDAVTDAMEEMANRVRKTEAWLSIELAHTIRHALSTTHAPRGPIAEED